jgi:hypothetical protein
MCCVAFTLLEAVPDDSSTNSSSSSNKSSESANFCVMKAYSMSALSIVYI